MSCDYYAIECYLSVVAGYAIFYEETQTHPTPAKLAKPVLTPDRHSLNFIPIFHSLNSTVHAPGSFSRNGRCMSYIVVCSIESKAVTVGMPVTRHPPYRSQACGTTALGSCLRSNAETLIWVWVQYPSGGYPLHHLPLHTFPGKTSTFLTPSTQRSEPPMTDLCPENIHSFSITRDCMIIEISLNH